MKCGGRGTFSLFEKGNSVEVIAGINAGSKGYATKIESVDDSSVQTITHVEKMINVCGANLKIEIHPNPEYFYIFANIMKNEKMMNLKKGMNLRTFQMTFILVKMKQQNVSQIKFQQKIQN